VAAPETPKSGGDTQGMTRSRIDEKRAEHTGTDTDKSVLTRFLHSKEHARAQAEQIDFLNAMIILLFGIGLFLAASSVVLNIAESEGPSKQYVALRGSERVADDLLVNTTEDVIANESCTEKFFAPEDTNSGCPTLTLQSTGQPEEVYVRDMLGVSSQTNEYTVNVSLQRDSSVWSGDLNGDGDTDQYAVGPALPENTETTTFVRHVTFGNIDADPQPEYFTVYVRVWS